MKLIRCTTLLFAGILIGYGLPTAVWAQQDQATGQAEATVEPRSIYVSEERPLSFGTFIPLGTTDGYVDVRCDGTFGNGNVVVLYEGYRAQWSVSGVPSLEYTVTIPTGTTISNGTNGMEVDTMVVYDDTNGSCVEQSLVRYLSSQGYDTFYLGAIVRVNQNQEEGTYAGSYDVTVAYN